MSIRGRNAHSASVSSGVFCASLSCFSDIPSPFESFRELQVSLDLVRGTGFGYRDPVARRRFELHTTFPPPPKSSHHNFNLPKTVVPVNGGCIKNTCVSPLFSGHETLWHCDWGTTATKITTTILPVVTNKAHRCEKRHGETR